MTWDGKNKQLNYMNHKNSNLHNTNAIRLLIIYSLNVNTFWLIDHKLLYGKINAEGNSNDNANNLN